MSAPPLPFVASTVILYHDALTEPDEGHKGTVTPVESSLIYKKVMLVS